MQIEKIKHHIAALKEKHRTIDEQVKLMESMPGSFKDEDINHFKKKRLGLKDEITKHEHSLISSQTTT